MIRTHLRWQDVDPPSLRGHCAVVLDVLRWSTVAVTALDAGADWVEAYATPEEARARAERLGREHVVLGGERNSLPIPGFDVGNSPREYARRLVDGKGVITTTTNGTQGLHAAREAAVVLVGAFINLDALAEAITREIDLGRPIALIACGQAGTLADEDVACAGALATLIAPSVMDVSTEVACGAWARAGRDAWKALDAAPHAFALRAEGFGPDVEYAARISASRCVPRLASDARLAASYGSQAAPSTH